MNIAKRYRWMVLDEKGKLKRPEDVVYTNWGLHPNGSSGGGFDSVQDAEGKLNYYIGEIATLPQSGPSIHEDFVLVTFYTKAD